MRKSLASGVLAALLASAAGAEPGWSVPKVPGASDAPFLVAPKTPYVDPSLAPPPGSEPLVAAAPSTIREVARIGGRWGIVTSLQRTPAHNKAVGGVANSYHLSGRAIDIARRPGVRHADIAAALKKAGFQLVESLDEGDHSHFAFAKPGDVVRAAAVVKPLFRLAAFDISTSVDSRFPRPAPRGAGN